MKTDRFRENLAHSQLSVRTACIHENKILLVEHSHDDNRGSFWVLPGGGVEKDETILEAAVREMKEETGLDCDPEGVFFTREVEISGVRGIEIYLKCRLTGGELKLGTDPEYGAKQVLKKCEWMNRTEFEDCRYFPVSLKPLLLKLINGDDIPVLPVPSYDILPM